MRHERRFRTGLAAVVGAALCVLVVRSITHPIDAVNVVLFLLTAAAAGIGWAHSRAIAADRMRCLLLRGLTEQVLHSAAGMVNLVAWARDEGSGLVERRDALAAIERGAMELRRVALDAYRGSRRAA